MEAVPVPTETRHANCCLFCLWREKEENMEITWQRDIDAALREASQNNRPVLLDFTAAPM